MAATAPRLQDNLEIKTLLPVVTTIRRAGEDVVTVRYRVLVSRIYRTAQQRLVIAARWNIISPDRVHMLSNQGLTVDTNLAIAAFAATVSFVFMIWAIGRA